MSSYTIKGGDTFNAIATQFKTTVAAIQAANPGVNPATLQVGQVINLPGGASSNTYTIKAGDNFHAIAKSLNVEVSAVLSFNPGIDPAKLQVGQVIKVPAPGSQAPPPSHPPPSSGGLVEYSGPASNFPSPNNWASYDSLWAHNSRLMKYNSSDSEIAILQKVIPQIAHESGVDARVILCMCMQETGGNVRAPTTLSPAPDFIKNTGIMQAHNGAVFNAADPLGSITEMVRDGAAGTKNGDGLKQCMAKFGGNVYEGLRAYNSGSVDRSNLSNGITATGHYVSMIANRLEGRVWTNM